MALIYCSSVRSGFGLQNTRQSSGILSVYINILQYIIIKNNIRNSDRLTQHNILRYAGQNRSKDDLRVTHCIYVYTRIVQIIRHVHNIGTSTRRKVIFSLVAVPTIMYRALVIGTDIFRPTKTRCVYIYIYINSRFFSEVLFFVSIVARTTMLKYTCSKHTCVVEVNSFGFCHIYTTN